MPRDPQDQRCEMYSLQMSSGFDAREQVTVGAVDRSCVDLRFNAMDGTPLRNLYYCRSLYNAGTASITVTFKIIGDTTDYVAEIPTGQWHHVYDNVQTIFASGTDSGTLRLGYVKRGKVDGTGEHLT